VETAAIAKRKQDVSKVFSPPCKISPRISDGRFYANSMQLSKLEIGSLIEVTIRTKLSYGFAVSVKGGMDGLITKEQTG
jgi:hypothetical protein